MVPVTLFRAGGEYGVVPSDEIDDLDIIHEYNPHDRRSAH